MDAERSWHGRQARKAILDDPLAQVVIGPYLEQVSAVLEGTLPRNLLCEDCRERLLGGLGKLMLYMAHDTLDSLVAQRLSATSPLWGADVRLAPRAEVVSARYAIAESIRSSHAAILDARAPLLRVELARQAERFSFATTEMCERIRADWHEIATLLLGARDDGMGTILDVSPVFGPTCNGGRRTCVVTSTAGRFVYKPHDCRVDVWLADVAKRHLPDTLSQPVTVVRSDGSGAWAFQEFIQRKRVIDEAGIGRYWHRMGRAIALFQVLGSGDLHRGNFVAAGERPSLIDAELVLSGAFKLPGDPLDRPDLNRASGGFGQDLASTVVHTTMLPGLRDGHNVSPLLEHGVNCLPLWAGEEHDVLGYERELLDGLDEGLAALAGHADELLQDILAAARLPVRKVIRSTDLYARLLMRLWKCDSFDPSTRRSLLEHLARPAARGELMPLSPLASSEAACLAAGDIPYFCVEAGSRTVVGPDGASDDELLETSAVERACTRLRLLDGAHRRFAHAVISLNLRCAQVPDSAPIPACLPLSRPLDAADAVAEAEKTFRKLEDLLIESPSGETSWLFRSDEEHTLIYSSVCLAHGLGGMAVFLAAFAPRMQDAQMRSRALMYLDGCVSRLTEAIELLAASRAIPEETVPLGMADGLGGIVRSLDLVTRALEVGGPAYATVRNKTLELLDLILNVLDRVDVERTRRFDVYRGCAGLLLALTQCRGASVNVAVQEVVGRLARRLLDARSLPTTLGVMLWDTLGTGWPVSGLGHGQAGIVAAIAGVDAIVPELADDVVPALNAALAWEYACYREGIGTWPDLRSAPVTDKVVHGVCLGAPGMGLCALAVRALSHDEQARAWAERLLVRADRSCADLPLGPLDTLDSGTLSVAEYLLSRGDVARAGCILGGVVRRAHTQRGYVFQDEGLRQTVEPDLLFGLAGVGYELLRYADPMLSGVLVG